MMHGKHDSTMGSAAGRMACRQFTRDLAEWAAGRLPADAAARMEGHRAACPACARAFAEEQSLRALFGGAAEAGPARADARTPELWDRVAARIATPSPASRPARPAWVEALRARQAPRALAFGGALGVAAIFGVAAWMHGGAPSGPAAVSQVGPGDTQVATSAPVDETHVLQLVSEMQSMPDPDSEYTLAASGVPRREARTILFGSAPNQSQQSQQLQSDGAAVTEP